MENAFWVDGDVTKSATVLTGKMKKDVGLVILRHVPLTNSLARMENAFWLFIYMLNDFHSIQRMGLTLLCTL